MTPPYKTCTFILPTGKRCGAPATDRSDFKFCFLHDPSIRTTDDVSDEEKPLVKEVLKRKKLSDYPPRAETVEVEEFDERHVEAVTESEDELPLKMPEDVEEAMRRVLRKQLTGQVSEEYANNVIRNLNIFYGVMATNRNLGEKLKKALEIISKGGEDAKKG